MSDDEETIFVHEDKIKEFMQHFLDHTQLAEKAGSCSLTEDQWEEELARFKNTFKRQFNGEYEVDVERAFTFINEVMLHLIERCCKVLEDEGKIQLGWSSEDNDFVYMTTEKK